MADGDASGLYKKLLRVIQEHPKGGDEVVAAVEAAVLRTYSQEVQAGFSDSQTARSQESKGVLEGLRSGLSDREKVEVLKSVIYNLYVMPTVLANRFFELSTSGDSAAGPSLLGLQRDTISQESRDGGEKSDAPSSEKAGVKVGVTLQIAKSSETLEMVSQSWAKFVSDLTDAVQ